MKRQRPSIGYSQVDHMSASSSQRGNTPSYSNLEPSSDGLAVVPPKKPKKGEALSESYRNFILYVSKTSIRPKNKKIKLRDRGTSRTDSDLDEYEFDEEEDNEIEYFLEPIEFKGVLVQEMRKLINHPLIQKLLKHTARLENKTNETVFQFPMNSGSSALFPHEWKLIFEFLDNWTTDVKQPKKAFTDLIYSERIKNAEYFWKLERIMKYLGLVCKSM